MSDHYTWKLVYRLAVKRGLRVPCIEGFTFEDDRLEELVRELDKIHSRENEIIKEIYQKGYNDTTKENQTKENTTKENTI